MRKSEIYEIAIKILGLYLFISILISLRESFSFLYVFSAQYSPEQIDNYKVYPELITFFVHFIVVTVLAFFFTFKSKTVVRLVCVPTDYEEEAKLLIDKRSIIEIALVFAGLMTIIWALPDFFVKIQHHIRLVQLNEPTTAYDRDFLLVSGLEILIGILVITFRNALSSYLSKTPRKEMGK